MSLQDSNSLFKIEDIYRNFYRLSIATKLPSLNRKSIKATTRYLLVPPHDNTISLDTSQSILPDTDTDTDTT